MDYSIFNFSLIALDPLQLPYYKGSTFRGLFGRTLKKIACVTGLSGCENCLLRHQCAYAYIFETFNQRDERVVHPFVFEPPLTEQRYFPPGSNLSLNLILFGRVLQYLPILVYTFKEMGRQGIGTNRGKFELSKVSTNRYIVFDKDEQIVRTDFKPQNLFVTPLQSAEHLRIHFVTPTALKSGGRIKNEIDFLMLLRAIRRRIKSLSVYHNNQSMPDLEIDFEVAKKIIIRSSSFAPFRWKRYSNRQKQKIDFSGVIGMLELEGDLTPFLPLLRMGEITHIGRGTVYGMGKYVIET